MRLSGYVVNTITIPGNLTLLPQPVERVGIVFVHACDIVISFVLLQLTVARLGITLSGGSFVGNGPGSPPKRRAPGRGLITENIDVGKWEAH